MFTFVIEYGIIKTMIYLIGITLITTNILLIILTKVRFFKIVKNIKKIIDEAKKDEKVIKEMKKFLIDEERMSSDVNERLNITYLLSIIIGFILYILPILGIFLSTINIIVSFFIYFMLELYAVTMFNK